MDGRHGDVLAWWELDVSEYPRIYQRRAARYLLQAWAFDEDDVDRRQALVVDYQDHARE